jgi:hypothetical protein
MMRMVRNGNAKNLTAAYTKLGERSASIEKPNERSLNQKLKEAKDYANQMLTRALSSKSPADRKEIIDLSRSNLNGVLKRQRNNGNNTSVTIGLLSILGPANSNKTNISINNYYKNALAANNQRKNVAYKVLEGIGRNLNTSRMSITAKRNQNASRALNKKIAQNRANYNKRLKEWNSRGMYQRFKNTWERKKKPTY